MSLHSIEIDLGMRIFAHLLQACTFQSIPIFRVCNCSFQMRYVFVAEISLKIQGILLPKAGFHVKHHTDF